MHGSMTEKEKGESNGFREDDNDDVDEVQISWA